MDTYAVDEDKFKIEDVTPEWTSYEKYIFDVSITPHNYFSIGKLATRGDYEGTYGDKKPYYATSTKLGLTFTNIVRTTSDFRYDSIENLSRADRYPRRSMDPKKRNCYFHDEKTLEFFPMYTEPNCMLECAWRAAAGNCGCVPWFLKSKERFTGDRICEIFGNRHVVWSNLKTWSLKLWLSKL